MELLRMPLTKGITNHNTSGCKINCALSSVRNPQGDHRLSNESTRSDPFFLQNTCSMPTRKDLETYLAGLFSSYLLHLEQ